MAELQRCEEAGERPTEVLASLDRLGVAACFTDPAVSSPYHLGALTETLARSSGSLGIILAVNGLALLPVCIAATTPQRQEVFEAVGRGARASLLLTEWDHGSDLLATETRAHASGDTFRLKGTKHLINGGSTHDLLVVLARSGAAGLSLFLARRDESVTALPAYATLCASGADISGARFSDTPAELIGTLGNGLGTLNKTLAISRGGVSALAAGTAASALEQALHHAKTRSLYGQPILELGAISAHIARLQALDALTAALSVKQAALVNSLGPGASAWTAMAKVCCCDLAEQAVFEGRQVLGARALLRDQGYERLVRDAPLYGVFDGTRHVVLDQVAHRLAQVSVLPSSPLDLMPRFRQVYSAAPRPLVEVAALPARPWLVSPTAWIETLGRPELAPLSALSSALLEGTRALRPLGVWASDQRARHQAAEVFAGLEALLALEELSDRSTRSDLGAVPLAGDDLAPVCRFARGWYGGRLCAQLRALLIRFDLDTGGLDDIERGLWHGAHDTDIP